jgi:Icc-related predicted phosphoesterase
MRVVSISDTHALHNRMDYPIPDGDLLIVAGDFTNVGEIYDVRKFAAFLHTLPHHKKILIAGNHDWGLANYNKEECKRLLKDFIYLEDQEVTIDGIKFYGSPVQPTFCDWAFNIDRGEPIARYWANIPNDVNILITHGPVHGILDLTHYDQEHAGCEELKKRIEHLSSLKVHISGHIHETYGTKTVGNVLYINASICDLKYRPINKPIVFDIDEETKEVKLIEE